MKLINFFRWIFSVIYIKVTKDYGMCCDEQNAIECSWDYYFNRRTKT